MDIIKLLEEEGIDKEIIEAFKHVNRRDFLPDEFKDEADEDHPIPLSKGQTTSQPTLIAKMLQGLELKKNHNVLEIGTGHGYLTALLAYLANKVITIERIPTLMNRAKEILKDYGNIIFKIDDGIKGDPENSPFDRIIVSASVRKVPKYLLRQLKDGGIMILPLGSPYFQILTKVIKKGDEIEKIPLTECIFVPLVSDLIEE